METKEKKAIAKEVVKMIMKQVKNNVDVDYKGINFTLSQKKALHYWLQPETKVRKGNRTKTIGGWNLVRNDIKVSKTWTNQETGITTSKDFEGVELEKDGKVIQPLFVNNGSVLKVWN